MEKGPTRTGEDVYTSRVIRGLSKLQLDEIASIDDKRIYMKNYIILSKDDSTDYLSLLLSGRVNAIS